MDLVSRAWGVASAWVTSHSPSQRPEEDSNDGPPSLGKHEFEIFWQAPLDEHVSYKEVPHYQRILTVLTQNFGKQAFLPRQVAAINVALAGYDLILSLPTSAGKSLCYQLPAIYGDGLTLVFSPTRLLIEDQIRKLHQLEGDWTTWAHRSHSDHRMDRAPDILKYARLFYICPEFLDKDKDKYKILEKLFTEQRVSRIVVDEAHQALNTDFRPTYGEISKLRAKYPKVPITLASASLKYEHIQELTRLFRMSGTCIRVHSPLSQRSNLHFSVFHVPCQEEGWRLRFIVDYLRKHEGQSGIIFAGTHNKTERVCKQLGDAGIENVDYYHSDRPDTQDILERFQTGKIRVVVSTCAFGEGIDKQDIRFVIHYLIPPSMTAYFQETGRAGRDGKESDCILLYSFKDIPRIATIVAKNLPRDERVLERARIDDLKGVLNYCYDSMSCRRQHIFTPFDDSSDLVGGTTPLQFQTTAGHQYCGGCDTCKASSPTFQSLHSEIGTVYAACNTANSVKASELRKMVALHLGVEKANTTIGFMAVTGALWMEFKSVDKGRFELWLQPGEMIDKLHIPLPIPYTGYLPRIVRKRKPQDQINNDEDSTGNEDKDRDPILPEDAAFQLSSQQEDQDPSGPPSPIEGHLKPQKENGSYSSEDRFIKLFRIKLKDVVRVQSDRLILSNLSESVLRNIYRKRDRLSGREDLSKVLKDCRVDLDAIEVLKYYWEAKLKDEILYIVEKELKVGRRYKPY